MKRATAIAIVTFGLSLSAPVFAADAGIKPDAKVTTKTPAKKATAPTSQPVKMPARVPTDVGGAITLAKDTFKAGKAKNWWLMSAGIIWIIMFLLKLFKLFKKMGKRWAYLTVAGLSMAAMLTAKFGAGVSWEAAVAVLTSGPFMAFGNDFVKRGILGREPSSSVNGK